MNAMTAISAWYFGPTFLKDNTLSILGYTVPYGDAVLQLLIVLIWSISITTNFRNMYKRRHLP